MIKAEHTMRKNVIPFSRIPFPVYGFDAEDRFREIQSAEQLAAFAANIPPLAKIALFRDAYALRSHSMKLKTFLLNNGVSKAVLESYQMRIAQFCAAANDIEAGKVEVQTLAQPVNDVQRKKRETALQDPLTTVPARDSVDQSSSSPLPFYTITANQVPHYVSAMTARILRKIESRVEFID